MKRRGQKNSIRWIRWRTARRQALCADGMNPSVAWELAKLEAKHRQRLARFVGSAQAEQAKLIFRMVEGGPRLALCAPICVEPETGLLFDVLGNDWELVL